MTCAPVRLLMSVGSHQPLIERTQLSAPFIPPLLRPQGMVTSTWFDSAMFPALSKMRIRK